MTALQYFALIAVLLMAVTSALTTRSNSRNPSRTTLQMVSKEEYMRPHFQVTASISTGASNIGHHGTLGRSEFSTGTTSTVRSSAAASSEQRVQDHCEDKGGCDLEEMTRLMEEFDNLNQSPSQLFTFEYQPENISKHKETQQEVDLKRHLRRMHEIADMEEH